ncbi:MAG: glycosyltransferase [Candidatus Hydrogenedentes bacterium]|nr:glycosyltransferase [Candidatus Hydrogenedentota bacterium]
MSRELRIAYMTGEYLRISPFVFIHREVTALRQAGIHVETISVRGISEEECVSTQQREEQKTTHMLLPCSPWRLAAAHGRLKFSSPRRYLRAFALAMKTRTPGRKGFFYQLAYFLEAGLVADLVRRHGLTHLHNHLGDSSCTVAMLAAELGGFTFSFTLHGPGIFFEPYRWRLDAKLARAAFVCCISHFCRSQAMLWTAPERWNRLHVVHCGVEPESYTQRQHEGAGKELLFIGRLTAAKGIPILLESMDLLHKSHPGVHLVLAGDGPDRDWVVSRAAELGLRDCVEVTGFLSPDSVKERLLQADVFVMASFAEGVPAVLMEAMASGLPVVATRIAGIPELVEDGVSGFLVPPGDASSLADRMRTLLDNPDLRNRMGAAGRAKIEREFDTRQEVAKIAALLRMTQSG